MKIYFILFVLTLTQASQVYGNFTDSQLDLIHHILDAAQRKYLPSDTFKQMSKFISEYLSQTLSGGYYWNVFIFKSGVSSAVLNDHPYRQQYYININKYSSYLTYVIWSDVSKMNYDFWVCGSKGLEQFGSGLTNDMIQKIKSIIEHAIIYKGDNVKDNAEYIKEKLYPGVWSIIIADPSALYSGYAYKSKTNEYVILEEYGIMKWAYLMIKLN